MASGTEEFPSDGHVGRDAEPMIRWVLAFVAFTTGIASLAVFQFLLPKNKLREILEQEGRVDTLLGQYFIGIILRLALSEAVAIFGLVLAMMTGNADDILPFAGAAVVLMGLSFPSQGALKSRLIGL
jgi:F0F1-type ATP synthase membrane subunit c/vacuolar-type H+-ATPase subunit K